MLSPRKFDFRAVLGAVAVLSTSVAHAGTDDMLTACIDRFVATTLPDFQGKLHVHKESGPATLPLALSSRYEVVVSAVDAAHGALASAVCKVKRDGTVISMTTNASPKLSLLAKRELVKTVAVAKSE